MQITIALAKGRLAEKAMLILEQCGIECDEMFRDTRKLIFFDKTQAVRFIMVKRRMCPLMWITALRISASSARIR